MHKQMRFFLRIILGVLILNLYAQGQVESETGQMAQSSTLESGGETPVLGEKIQRSVRVRDPFWPVGYEPAVAVAKSVALPTAPVDETGGHVDFSGLTKEEQAVIKSKMVVGGILQQGSACLAIINQQLVKEGEEVSLAEANKSYQFKVKKLTPEKILLESMQEKRG